MFAPKTILVGTDFSEFSDRALKDATEIAENYRARLILLHVVDEDIQQCVADYCLSSEVFAQVQMNSKRASLEKMNEEAGKVSPRKNGLEYKVRTGSPYAEILKEQQEDKADLIILGAHGKRGVVSNILGSVADKVTRGASVPVLVVR